MMKPDYYNPLLFFEAGSHEAATRKLQNIKRRLMSVGKMLKRYGAQVVFSVLPVGDWDTGRTGRTDRLNDCVVVSHQRLWVL